ncbi:MAG: C69 family dipeptidase [Terricaulis sp.]
MCDSFVALPHRAAAGAMLFAKNSDRERNEAQALEFKPAAEHDAGASLLCSYITIPQARRTNACLISRPFWMWGAEMGANEHGVVIGNEAMHSVIAPSETPALTGMDLLRLALERAASAAEAVNVIAALLEAHGQGGNCGHLHQFFYHNGFLIADGQEAFVLETVGRSWACERVSDERALSNAYSIGRNYERVSADLAGDQFDFAERFIDTERDGVSFGRGRCARGGQLLAERGGKLTQRDMMAILRDHGEDGAPPQWSPERTPRRTICMHAAEGVRRSQTTASWVSEWTPGGLVHWVTATAAPCLSIFKPVVLGAAFPRDDYAPTDKFNRRSRWWKHELWHRAALGNHEEFTLATSAQRDDLEGQFVGAIRKATPDTIEDVIASCWRAADAAEDAWTRLAAHDGYAHCGADYAASWAEHDRVGMVPPR